MSEPTRTARKQPARDVAGSYRREARRVLGELKGFQLRAARDFLSFLRLKDSNDPTIEILEDKKLALDLRSAIADWRKGRRSKFTRWLTVK